MPWLAAGGTNSFASNNIYTHLLNDINNIYNIYNINNINAVQCSGWAGVAINRADTNSGNNSSQ